MNSSIPFKVAIILIPGFSLMSFSSLVEPMRGANRATGKTVFKWVLASPDGGTVFASNGMSVGTEICSLVETSPFDLVVICGGQEDESYVNRRLRETLRQLRRREIMIGSVSTGTFILAEAGILDDRRCTTHWDYIEAFREAYPRIDVCNELFVMDRKIFTCAGGIAALDVMLLIIRNICGVDIANLVSENFVYGTIREAHDNQRMSLRLRLGVTHPTLLIAVAAMEANTEAPLRLPDIARQIGLSQRQLERLFRERMGVTAIRYYSRLRLEKARRLLRRSSMSVLEIAVASGFTSASHFSRSFRQQFGISPSAARNEAPPTD